ncbi:TetR/AcrR family transcriptional regulator [Candidatus Solirubrobacter pratensis]|uniref:TetR/AcrR family transcriptional regulator n=1 Tax=Candidatus Solirubrobacter pratensis TaxID=1298857 RepID=UPI0004051CC7|nr:TetR family transcriptional regulator C-terminal domain-containing protein [Candidatus Solirubrobacter pratensis]
MARPRDQTQRRAQLVDVAHAVAARKGLSGVQLRDVAQAAGLTSGAVKYYFDDLDALFFAAYERAIERFCAERERVVATIDDPWEALAAALRLGVPTGPGDAEIRLLYEFEAVAFRSAECARMMAGYVDRQVTMYADILRRGVDRGAFAIAGDLRGVARNLVALEDGHGVYVLTGHVEPAAVERLLLEHAATVTGRQAASRS